MRHLRLWKWKGMWLGPSVVRAIPLICLATVIIRVTAIYAHATIEEPWPRGNMPRAELLHRLVNMPGQHLIVVRYAASHLPDPEWVYNAADIDNARIVWARDLGPMENEKLRTYYPDRSVYLLEPDFPEPRLTPW